MKRLKLIITLAAIVLLVLYGYFGLGYLKGRNEHKVLASQTADISQTLSQVSEPAEDQEQRLSDLRARLAAEQNVFPDKLNSTQIINDIFRLADECGIKAIPIVTQPWSTEYIGQHDYSIFRLNISAEGDLPQLLSFVSILEESEYSTLIIEDVSVSAVREQFPGDNATQEIKPFTASLDVAVYTQSLTQSSN